MKRLTVKQIDGTYHIYDNNVIRKANCCDENNKNWFSLYEGNAIDKLGEYEDLEEQGRLIKLPCKVGDAVYVITTCKYFGKVLDGTLWGDNGGFGTATGHYCPYELSDSCPHEDGFEECEGGCECFENKLAVFEDCVECITVYEHETVVFLINCGSVSFDDFGKTVFLTKEEAEKALERMKGE